MGRGKKSVNQAAPQSLLTPPKAAPGVFVEPRRFVGSRLKSLDGRASVGLTSRMFLSILLTYWWANVISKAPP